MSDAIVKLICPICYHDNDLPLDQVLGKLSNYMMDKENHDFIKPFLEGWLNKINKETKK